MHVSKKDGDHNKGKQQLVVSVNIAKERVKKIYRPLPKIRVKTRIKE